ncbi:MAG: MBL fold metallo-hydrolase [Candidatus Aceula meridiana]|nr:MBL fold metallo-hydrolase [Candidatus Aceula meridiana]
MSAEKNIIIKQMEVGPMQNYIYFVGDQSTSEVAVVDPAWDIPFLRQKAEEDDLKIVAAFLTHGHYDHADGVNELLALYDVPVYISEKESDLYLPHCRNLTKVKNHQKIKIGKINIECIFTPGHTPGCQCFYVPGHLITGDTLFVDGCGRCDLPGGDPHAMYDSLYNVIGKLPDDTVIYPGHFYGAAPTATLKEQKKTNLFFTSSSEEEFLSKRMVI